MSIKSINISRRASENVYSCLNDLCPCERDAMDEDDEDNSHSTNCLYHVRPCEYADLGCEFMGNKIELEHHLAEKVSAHLQKAVNMLRAVSVQQCEICSDGCFMWKIQNFRSHYQTDDAESITNNTAIYSLPFYTSKYGYKLKMKAYLNGYGEGRNSHISLFLMIIKGEYDNILSWPFSQKVIFYVLDQGTSRKHHKDEFVPVLDSMKVRSALAQPTEEVNPGVGNPTFVSLNKLLRGSFVKDDQIFIKIQIQ